MLTGHAVVDVQRNLDGWAIWTAERHFAAARVIVTTGGCSYPGCGTRGDGYDWMRRLGHSIVTPRPALVPLTTDERWIHDLSGVTLDDVQVWVVPAESLGGKQDAAELLASCRRRMLAQRRGSLLFTHQGLSGPAAMDVSREVTRFDDPDAIRFVCDFLPHQSLDALQAHLEQEAQRQGARTAGRFLAGHLPQRLANQLLGRAGIDPQRPLAELSRTARRDLLRQVKATVVRLTGTRGFPKAEVTAGGVALTDVDPRTMASKRVPDLYLAGELLDVDGPIGGYNFQAAFSTGRLAASTAAR
jgi:predicted Rossmann fold flavoprotein